MEKGKTFLVYGIIPLLIIILCYISVILHPTKHVDLFYNYRIKFALPFELQNVSTAPKIEEAVSEIHTGIILKNNSDKIKFLGYSVSQLNDSKAKLRLYFAPLDKIKHNYVIWVHGMPENKTLLPENRKNQGFITWDHAPQKPTKHWEEGLIYIDEKIINVKKGNYKITFGFWRPNAKGKNVRLYNRRKTEINLGWVNFSPGQKD